MGSIHLSSGTAVLHSIYIPGADPEVTSLTCDAVEVQTMWRVAAFIVLRSDFLSITIVFSNFTFSAIHPDICRASRRSSSHDQLAAAV
jgi:hypothetical protein